MRRWRLAAAVVAGGVLALGAGWIVSAQTNEAPGGGDQNSSDAAPPGVPILQAPPEPATPPAATPPDSDNDTDNDDHGRPSNAVAANTAAADIKPVPPPTPVRSPVAVLQALDKVTTETMRFASPVNQRVRYKNLVFTVKTCETTGVGDPEPLSAAYVIVDSQPQPIAGHAPAPAKEVFRGWMFANSPGLHPLQHPVYDAWLIACIAAPPPA